MAILYPAKLQSKFPRRVVASLVTCCLLAILTLAGETGASAVEAKRAFSNCDSFNLQYPTGVARTELKALTATERGFQRPQVSKRIFDRARRANAKLGGPRDGVLCEVPVDVSPRTEISPAEYLASVKECRLTDQTGDPVIRIGFPNSAERVKSIGSARAVVVYLDFADARATATTDSPESNFNRFAVGVERFYSAMSGGQLSFSWDVYPQYVSMPGTLQDLDLTRSNPAPRWDLFVEEVLKQTDPFIDYTRADFLVMAINPDAPAGLSFSPGVLGRPGIGFPTREGTLFNATFLGSDAQRLGDDTLAHEIGHLLGLVDLYDFSGGNAWKFLGEFDFMNKTGAMSREMLGWSRWLMSWVSDDQIRCVTEATSTTHLLSPFLGAQSRPMIAIRRLSESKVLVLESKRANAYCLCTPGVFAYTVDTSVSTGQGPIRAVTRFPTVQPGMESILKVGDSISIDGVLVEIVESGDYGDVVRISGG